MREHQVTSARHGVTQDLHKPADLLMIRKEVEQGHEEHPDRPFEVDQAPYLRVVENLRGLADIGLDHTNLGVAPQYGLTVRNGNRVDIHIDDPSIRIRPLGNLVNVSDRRDAGPNVKELVNALAQEKLHG